MTREEYLVTIEEKIRCKKAMPLIRTELEAHIDDQKEAYIQGGIDEDEAERLAVREMGDPVKTGEKLDYVHRPKNDWILPGMAFVLVIFGIVMQSIIFPNMDNGYVQDTYQLKTILNNMVGIAVMFVVWRIDYRILEKYIWQIYLCSIVVSIYMHMKYYSYGQTSQIGNMACMCFVIIFAGFVYHFREEKTAGFLKSLGIILINNFFCVVFLNYSMMVWLVAQMACFVTMFAAIFKGIYKGNKKVQLSMALVCFVGAPGAVLADVLLAGGRHIGLAVYQVERIKAILGLAEESYYSYMADFARQEIKQATLFGGKSLGQFQTWSGAYSDYVLTCTVTYFGLVVAALVVLVSMAFLLRALCISIHQKNKLGYLLSVAASLVLIAKSVIYVCSNMGLIPGSSIDMPFLSYGYNNALINYAYLGIILSVYRYTNVFGEIHKKKSRSLKGKVV